MGTSRANLGVEDRGDRAEYNELAADYVFKKIKEIAGNRKNNLLIVMDGDRASIYRGLASDRLYAAGALRLNRLAQKLAEKYAIPFIDLHPVFEEDYRLNNRLFDFGTDRHWNEYGHEIVANAIYRYLLDHIIRGRDKAILSRRLAIRPQRTDLDVLP